METHPPGGGEPPVRCRCGLDARGHDLAGTVGGASQAGQKGQMEREQ